MLLQQEGQFWQNDRIQRNPNAKKKHHQAHLHREPERGVGEQEREWKEDEAGGGDDEGVAGEGEEAAQQDAHQVAAHRD